LNDELPPQAAQAAPTQEQQYEMFVNHLVTFLMERRGAMVLVLVETPDRGFENFRNTNSFAWLLGALKVAKKMLKHLMKQIRLANKPLIEQHEKEMADRIELMDKKKEKAN